MELVWGWGLHDIDWFLTMRSIKGARIGLRIEGQGRGNREGG